MGQGPRAHHGHAQGQALSGILCTRPQVNFDETWRYRASQMDYVISEIADALRDQMLASDNPLSESKWRQAGYRFAHFLAGNRQLGVELTREFARGMRIFAEENESGGAPVLYDTKRAAAVEEKGEKLLVLATHTSANEHEAHAARSGFIKLFSAEDLAIVAAERLTALRQALARMTDTINFLNREHPNILLWKRDSHIERP